MNLANMLNEEKKEATRSHIVDDSFDVKCPEYANLGKQKAD
jgi:hypothetical protein